MISSKNEVAIWVKYQCSGMGVCCQFCKYWQHLIEDIGECKVLGITSRATFFCTDWNEVDTAIKLP